MLPSPGQHQAAGTKVAQDTGKDLFVGEVPADGAFKNTLVDWLWYMELYYLGYLDVWTNRCP